MQQIVLLFISLQRTVKMINNIVYILWMTVVIVVWHKSNSFALGSASLALTAVIIFILTEWELKLRNYDSDNRTVGNLPFLPLECSISSFQYKMVKLCSLFDKEQGVTFFSRKISNALKNNENLFQLSLSHSHQHRTSKYR